MIRSYSSGATLWTTVAGSLKLIHPPLTMVQMYCVTIVTTTYYNNKIMFIKTQAYLQWDNHSMCISYRMPSLIHKAHLVALRKNKLRNY